jgi:hypothetical protein
MALKSFKVWIISEDFMKFVFVGNSTSLEINLAGIIDTTIGKLVRFFADEFQDCFEVWIWVD